MVKFKEIVQDCINGCTKYNADERRMHFNIKYYVNQQFGQGIPKYVFVYNINDLEENLYKIVNENLSRETDVVISDITIKHHGEIMPVNSKRYPYSLSYVMQELCK